MDENSFIYNTERIQEFTDAQFWSNNTDVIDPRGTYMIHRGTYTIDIGRDAEMQHGVYGRPSLSAS